jgi:hypothetical protein
MTRINGIAALADKSLTNTSLNTINNFLASATGNILSLSGRTLASELSIASLSGNLSTTNATLNSLS